MLTSDGQERLTVLACSTSPRVSGCATTPGIKTTLDGEQGPANPRLTMFSHRPGIVRAPNPELSAASRRRNASIL